MREENYFNFIKTYFVSFLHASHTIARRGKDKGNYGEAVSGDLNIPMGVLLSGGQERRMYFSFLTYELLQKFS